MRTSFDEVPDLSSWLGTRFSSVVLQIPMSGTLKIRITIFRTFIRSNDSTIYGVIVSIMRSLPLLPINKLCDM